MKRLEGKAQRIFTAIFFATFFAMFGETIPQSFQPLFIASLGVTLVLSLVVVAMRGYFD